SPGLPLLRLRSADTQHHNRPSRAATLGSAFNKQCVSKRSRNLARDVLPLNAKTNGSNLVQDCINGAVSVWRLYLCAPTEVPNVVGTRNDPECHDKEAPRTQPPSALAKGLVSDIGGHGHERTYRIDSIVAGRQ